MSESKYTNKHVIFCEGSTDIEFFTTVLAHKLDVKKNDLENKSTIEADSSFSKQLEEIVFVDGQGDNLKNILIEELLKTLENNPPKSITILVDGDEKLNIKLKYFKNTFNKDTSYQNPQNKLFFETLNCYQPYTIKKGSIEYKIQMGVFTVQGDGFKDLETLCLKIAMYLNMIDSEHQEIVDGFVAKCDALTTVNPPKYLDKAKAQVYLASMEQWCDSKFSAGLNKGYLDKEHDALKFLDPIVDILKPDFPKPTKKDVE
jgi:hypothetical protein